MSFDIRIPIGSMFGILGALLFVYGLISGPEIYARSLGLNVNVLWGAVLLAFAATMLALSWRRARRERRPPV